MKLYIISGTSSGLGKQIALELLQNNENVVWGLSRHQTISHPNYIHHSLNLLDIKTVKSFEFPNGNEYAQISLINNAGTLGEIAPLVHSKIEDLDTCIQVNYTSLMILSTLFIQKYQELPLQKTIVNISSGAANSPYSSWANYCSSKAAVEMLSKCIGQEQENEKYPIECFAIAPGVVDTAMQEKIRSTDPSMFDMKSKFVEMYEEKKLFDPKYVAQKLIQICDVPFEYSEKIFRIV